MYGALDISTSGMIAQRTRLAVIASNIAGADTLLNAKGEYEPYLKKAAIVQAGDPTARTRGGRALGVHVAEIRSDPNALRERYDPDHPFADERGYLKVPDINSTIEQINAMEAARAYEANVVAAETTKTMTAQALRLLA
jgi:flagellar basal-body rod protein FlgC